MVLPGGEKKFSADEWRPDTSSRSVSDQLEEGRRACRQRGEIDLDPKLPVNNGDEQLFAARPVESEGVKATACDPTGRALWSRDVITLPERHTATAPGPSER